MTVFGLLWTLMAWMFCIAVSGVAAHSKGRNSFLWAVAGLFFGPLSLLALVACGARTPTSVPPHSAAV